jgi:chaperonin GroES
VLDNGDVKPLDVKVGDKVLFGAYVERTEKIDGQEYVITKEDNILGVILD